MTSPDSSSNRVVRLSKVPRFFLLAWFDVFARRAPFWALVFVALASNVGGTLFSFFYNTQLIVGNQLRQDILNERQQMAFWDQAVPVYNTIAWPVCFAVVFYVLAPLMRCLGRLRRGEAVDPVFFQFCQRRLVNFPIFQLSINLIGILPGAVIFPWIITSVDPTRAGEIWTQFMISFFISAVFTTAQTFFLLQTFLTAYLYPEFFKDSRPETVPGAIPIPFALRLLLLWLAIVLMPLIASLTVALNITNTRPAHQNFVWGLVVASAFSGAGIFWLVGRDLRNWIRLQTEATGEIAKGNFDIRIDQPRPDEWGLLTNHFNDMASALGQAWESHETLGQFVSPDVRDHILRQTSGLEVQLQEVTVLFVDIRDFTPRCADQTPQHIGALLNRFLTLVVSAIEEKGGYVNKFLGDGVLALFGATHHQHDHADLALASALDLLERLKTLNEELIEAGDAPLVLGIGIHTGPALVGCFGAVLKGDRGQPIMRREFTAIGETVNLCQRIEQLTKTCGGPILLTDDTRERLTKPCSLVSVGPQELKGCPEPKIVHRAV